MSIVPFLSAAIARLGVLSEGTWRKAGIHTWRNFTPSFEVFFPTNLDLKESILRVDALGKHLPICLFRPTRTRKSFQQRESTEDVALPLRQEARNIFDSSYL